MRGGALCLILCAAVACGGGDDEPVADATPGDADGDGVSDVSDNCPNVTNPDQSDQDADGIGDACDCANDNDKTIVANADMEDSDRDANSRSCDKDEILTGVVEGRAADGSVDTIGFVCTQRCDPFASTEAFGEQGFDSRGPDVTCPAGDVVVGIAYKDVEGETAPNDRLHTFTLLCAPMAGPDTDPSLVPNAALDANTQPLISLQCPEGATAAGVVDIDSDNASNDSDALDGVTIQCRDGRW